MVVLLLATLLSLLVATTGGADRLRVVTIGDSVAFDGDPGIRAALEATGAARVDTRSFGGVGLLRPGFDDYLDDILDGGPEVVVVMLGGWDLDGLVADPAAYGRRLDDVADRMAGRGATVLWLGMPPAPSHEGIEAARRVANGQFAALAGRHSDVHYLDTGLALGDPGGGFTRRLGAWRRSGHPRHRRSVGTVVGGRLDQRCPLRRSARGLRRVC